ncbi:MAG: hypothetical protein D9C04_04015 [Nitrosopumilus sp. B06]|nr:MAG: hypothetical protein EB828_04870 [Nitrosopumilus sp. D6]RNJ79670.1 MAG: hypothetical protein D9C04_04015 [Nitrosopumilus sp. B06]
MPLTAEEQMILIQHVIKRHPSEQAIVEKLGPVMPEKEVQRGIDSLIGTQRVRRIGPDILQNNESHTELPVLSESLAGIIDGLDL